MNENVKTTTDHEEIKAWAEKHRARPAIMEDSSGERKHGLRFDFPGKEDEELLTEETHSDRISWEEFFKIFDEEKLALILYADEEHRASTWSYRFINKDARKDTYEEKVQGMVREMKEALGVIESVPMSQEEDNLDPALKGETGNDTLKENPSPEMMGEQSMMGDMSDPASDDDTTLVAKEMGLLLKEDKKRLDES
jgi:hypothetical protein